MTTTTTTDALLRVRDLTVDYGGVRAVDGLDLDVPRGSVVGLIGANGAGKTTTLDALTGFAPLSSGTVQIGSHDVTRAQAHLRCRLGMSRTFQGMQLFKGLTVRENALVAAEAGGAATRRDVAALADAALATMELTDVEHHDPASLSLGRQRLVAVARALASDPTVLLLDEPAAGLDTRESLAFGDRLRELADRGLGVLLVEHDMGLVLAVCDRIQVMDFGRLIASGAPAEIRKDPAVLRAYLGGDLPDEAPVDATSSATTGSV